MRKINLVGQDFERLTVIAEWGRDVQGQITWICLCDCGEYIAVRGRDLRTGNTKSCGCLRTERTRKNSTTHGMTGTPTYRTWHGMLHRCNNPRHTFFKNYGRRGITVCDKWLKFAGFFEDMGLRPKGLTLERKNNDLGYYKENCCYADKTTQARNRRMQKNNTTGFTGVSLHKPTRKYMATICVSSKKKYLGLFTSIHEATEARREAEIKYWK